MARIRTIKPDSAVSLSTQGVSIEARYFFQNLWCHLDDEGRCEWLPKMLLAMIFPSEDDPYTVADLNRWLAELESKDGMLVRYEVNGTVYVCAPKFKDHQVINRPSKSKHPPLTQSSLSIHGGLTEDSLEERKGKGREQGTGKGGALSERSVSATNGKPSKPDDGGLWEIFQVVPGYARGSEPAQRRSLSELARDFAWVPPERLAELAKACRDHYAVKKQYGHESVAAHSAAKDFRDWLRREGDSLKGEPDRAPSSMHTEARAILEAMDAQAG